MNTYGVEVEIKKYLSGECTVYMHMDEPFFIWSRGACVGLNFYCESFNLTIPINGGSNSGSGCFAAAVLPD